MLIRLISKTVLPTHGNGVHLLQTICRWYFSPLTRLPSKYSRAMLVLFRTILQPPHSCIAMFSSLHWVFNSWKQSYLILVVAFWKRRVCFAVKDAQFSILFCFTGRNYSSGPSLLTLKLQPVIKALKLTARPGLQLVSKPNIGF